MSPTPTPWKVERDGKDSYITASDTFHSVVCDMRLYRESPFETAENARLIVRAVNAHAALVAALQDCAAQLRILAQEFNSPYFTDRHGDGPVCERLAGKAQEALALTDAEAPRP